jgi:hypothetical protein
METALLGQFQPQTQQTGFASRKFSLLVKERDGAQDIFPSRRPFVHPCARIGNPTPVFLHLHGRFLEQNKQK